MKRLFSFQQFKTAFSSKDNIKKVYEKDKLEKKVEEMESWFPMVRLTQRQTCCTPHKRKVDWWCIYKLDWKNNIVFEIFSNI